MTRTIFTIIISIFLVCCGYFKKEEQADPEPVQPVPPPQQTWLDDLKTYQNDLLNELKIHQNDLNGWPTDDCDGWIWASKAVIAGLTGVDLLASEYPDDPGKFGRRPPMPRWCYQGRDYGSKSTWSRDMAVAGLIPYAIYENDLTVLQRHAQFGERTGWKMGDPDTDAVHYTPSLIAMLYKSIKFLGGSIPDGVTWLEIYTKGLKDYQAHLQMYSILIRAQIEHELPVKAIDRIREHAFGEPYNAFYDYLYRRFSDGSYSNTARMLLDGLAERPDYVRCGDQAGCWLAERVFVAELIIREYE